VNRHVAFGVAATIAVAIGLALGFWSLGGRGRQRAIGADQRRSEHLARIAAAIDAWYLRRRELPAALSDLRGYDPRIVLYDPVTGSPYEYKPAGSAYELCATFAFEGAGGITGAPRDLRFYSHTAGRQCFPVEAPR
jgi:hypothetical protein